MYLAGMQCCMWHSTVRRNASEARVAFTGMEGGWQHTDKDIHNTAS